MPRTLTCHRPSLYMFVCAYRGTHIFLILHLPHCVLIGNAMLLQPCRKIQYFFILEKEEMFTCCEQITA
uniref:Uncharacterized protein n=1 Tax=Anguilla anguilla TaxID=7936 RepID=A0A0E9WHZ8_ANGAN